MSEDNKVIIEVQKTAPTIPFNETSTPGNVRVPQPQPKTNTGGTGGTNASQSQQADDKK